MDAAFYAADGHKKDLVFFTSRLEDFRATRIDVMSPGLLPLSGPGGRMILPNSKHQEDDSFVVHEKNSKSQNRNCRMQKVCYWSSSLIASVILTCQP